MFKFHAKGGVSVHLSDLVKAWFGFDLQEWLHPLRAADDSSLTDVPVAYVADPRDPSRMVPVLPSDSGSNDPLTAHVRYVIATVDRERQTVEDTRANRRNRNRMLTLLGALVIGLGVTYILNAGYLGTFGPVLAPYAFTITIAMDSTLAAYSWLRHY